MPQENCDGVAKMQLPHPQRPPTHPVQGLLVHHEREKPTADYNNKRASGKLQCNAQATCVLLHMMYCALQRQDLLAVATFFRLKHI